MPFAGLGRTVGGLAVASVAVKVVRRVLPKKIKTARRSYLKTVSIQSRKLRTGQISTSKFRKNMAAFRKQARSKTF